MIKILVYNHVSNRMETYYLNLNNHMPYNTGRTLSVNEFRGKSLSNVIWTTRSTMESWNSLRSAWGKPIYIGYAFRRIGEGGHSDQSQHYAGTAFDMGQNLAKAARDQLRITASNTKAWSYVEPANLTPTWVHVDKRQGPPACASGYPQVLEGSKGVYVALLQDALLTIGDKASSVDGVFGRNTKNSVIKFQSKNGLVADGIVGCLTWKTLTKQANNYFRR